jgi:transposase
MGAMTPEVLFTAALQLEAGWKVTECRFEGEPRRLLLKLDFEQGKRFGCPQCGKLCPTHDTSTKRWRHLNFFQYECLLEARVPRSNCPEHGVLSVAVPWAREGSGFTLLFEALAMLLCREMPMAAVSDTLGEHDTRLWRVAAHYVEAAHAKSSWAEVRRISVDETSARRGHRYVTNVLDAETHDLLLMVEGRSAEALEAFAQALVAHGGEAQQIELISMDMSPAYQSGASRFFPGAQIVFDRFHLMQMAGQALEKVRKELARQGADLKGSLWALRGNEWTRNDEQRQQRSALCNRYPKLGRAIGLRDMLQDILADEDQEALRWWCKRRAFDNIGAALPPSSKLDSPMARSRRLTVCSNLLSVWPEDSAPCVTSA